MSPKQTWYAWLESQVRRFSTAKECAAAWGLDESKLSRWRRVPLQEPTATDMEALAVLTKTPLPEILLMVWAATKERDALRARPTVGETAAPTVSPWPRPSGTVRSGDATRSRRRRKLAAFVLGLVSGGWSVIPPPAGGTVPITDQVQVAAVLRDYENLRRKKAA